MLYSPDLFGVISRSRHDIQSQGAVGGYYFLFFYFCIFEFSFFLNFHFIPHFLRHRSVTARDISILGAVSAPARVLKTPL